MKKNRIGFSLTAALLALVMVLSMSATTLPAEVQAKTSSEWNSEISRLEKEKDKLKEEMKEIQSQIDENYSEIEKIVAQKNIIDQEIFLLNQQILTVNEQITTYGLLIADKQEELDLSRQHLRELTQKNKERIRAMEENGELTYWGVLFEANSFSDLLDRMEMVNEIAASDKRRLQEMDAAAQEVEAAQEALEAEKAQLEVTRLELDDTQVVLDAKRAEADKLLADLNAKGAEFDKLMDEAEEQEREFTQQIAKAEKEYNAAVKQEQSNSAPPPSGNYGVDEMPGNTVDGITWLRPCKYVYLSSPYGWRIHPVYGYPKFHTGVDLAGPQGTPIVASRAGTVTAATYNSGSGYYVTINHHDGFSTSYMHLTHYIVTPGDKVAAGQVIGYMGSTGVSTGPHLHFNIYYNGDTVNPANYIHF